MRSACVRFVVRAFPAPARSMRKLPLRLPSRSKLPLNQLPRRIGAGRRVERHARRAIPSARRPANPRAGRPAARACPRCSTIPCRTRSEAEAAVGREAELPDAARVAQRLLLHAARVELEARRDLGQLRLARLPVAEHARELTGRRAARSARSRRRRPRSDTRSRPADRPSSRTPRRGRPSAARRRGSRSRPCSARARARFRPADPARSAARAARRDAASSSSAASVARPPHQIVRCVRGKSRQTGTPQKCEPSVQRGRTSPRAHEAGRADVAHQLGVHGAHLRDLVHRGLPDLALRVQTGAHRPLVQQVEQGAGLFEADRERVREHVERELRRDAAGQQARARVPGRFDRLREQRVAGRILADQLRLDHVDARRARCARAAAASPAPSGVADPANRPCARASCGRCSARARACASAASASRR